MYPSMVKQANLPGIAAGAKCTMPLPAEGVHHGLYLMCRKAASAPMSRAEIIADVGQITIWINGKEKIQATATVLLDLHKYWHDKDGAFTVAGLIPIPFTRPILPTAIERSLLAWGMKDVRSYVLEVDITAVATLVSIEVWCEIEAAQRNLGRHICITPHVQNFATTGVHEITTLPFGDPDVGILVDHIDESTGDIDNVEVKTVTESIFGKVPMEANNHLLRQYGRVGQTDYYHVDYSVVNDQTGYLESGPLKALRYLIDWETAGGAPSSYTITREEVRGLQVAVV